MKNKEIKNLIARDEIEQALQLILDNLENINDNENINYGILLSSRFHDIRKRFMRN